jgi:hypothetical protein
MLKGLQQMQRWAVMVLLLLPWMHRWEKQLKCSLKQAAHYKPQQQKQHSL